MAGGFVSESRDIVAKIKNDISVSDASRCNSRNVIGRGWFKRLRSDIPWLLVCKNQAARTVQKLELVAIDRQKEREREIKKNIEEQRGSAANWNHAAATTSFRAARRFRAKIQWLNRVIIPKTINDDVATPPFCSRPTNRRQLSSVLYGAGN